VTDKDREEESSDETRERLEAIRAGDGGRYHADAYGFVLDAVAFTLSDIDEIRHVTGSELCDGAKKLAVERFGPMAKEVLNFWGVCATEDIGNIVFALVEAKELSTTEGDSIADFFEVFDFDEAFERDYFA
jgi:uncharacterized repeat protein (TIGR04138 family)